MISLATKHNDPDKTLGWGERIGYASGAFGWNMVNGIIGTFLTVYFTNVAMLDAAVISTIIAVSKLFDGVSDLIVGRMVDNTKSKMGKARPWLMRMCIPFAITTILLFFVPQGFPSALKYVYVFIMYNLVNAVCLTAIQVPFYSLISLMTRNSYERGFLGNIQQIFQTLGNVFVNAVFTIMLTKFSSSAETYFTQQAFTVTITILCAIMVVVCMITAFSTKERVTDKPEAENEGEGEEEKVPVMTAIKALLTNKYWVMMFFAMLCIFFVIIFYSIGGVYYAIYIFGDMGQISWMNNAISIAQFAIMFATPFFMKKFGKRPIYTAGMLCLTLGFLGFGFVDFSKPLMIACNVLKGLGLGMSGGMAMGMVADAILYGQLKTGINAVGMGNAGTSAAQKLGLGLGQAIFGWVLSGAGFDASLDAQGIAQPESVITAIKFMYNYIPMIMCAIIFVLMLVFFNLERDLNKLKKEKGIE
ncbi:MAG: MFS transporter [Mogibacterium sp.]|nr:MFS transporter [Mogibacterium sp.]